MSATDLWWFISQYWFRLWLGAIRLEAINWANVDTDLCRHIMWLGHNQLNIMRSLRCLSACANSAEKPLAKWLGHAWQQVIINSLRLSDVYLRHQISPSLAEIMACHLFSTKPLSAPVLYYCQLDSWEQTSVKLYLKLSFKKIHLEVSAILSWPQCVNWTSVYQVSGCHMVSLNHSEQDSS